MKSQELDGWTCTADGVVIPVFLVDVLVIDRQKVPIERPDEKRFQDTINAFQSAIHKLFNDSCRVLGVDIGEVTSEWNWEATHPLARKLSEFIKHEWEIMDVGERRHRADQLEKYYKLKSELDKLASELNLTEQEKEKP